MNEFERAAVKYAEVYGTANSLEATLHVFVAGAEWRRGQELMQQFSQEAKVKTAHDAMVAEAVRLGVSDCIKKEEQHKPCGDVKGGYDTLREPAIDQPKLPNKDYERDVLIDVTASLSAAVSLLERSPKTAAPSNRMFDTMLSDYRASLRRARELLLWQARNEEKWKDPRLD